MGIGDEKYAETHIKRKGTPASVALKITLILAITLLFFLASIFGSIVLMIGVAAAFFVVWYWPRFDVEWEYVFVDGQMDFDKIMGGSTRKTILRIDFDAVELVAKQTSHALDPYREYKIKDFTSLKKDVVPYVIVAKVEKEVYRLHIEPNVKTLNAMKSKAPRKVIIES